MDVKLAATIAAATVTFTSAGPFTILVGGPLGINEVIKVMFTGPSGVLEPATVAGENLTLSRKQNVLPIYTVGGIDWTFVKPATKGLVSIGVAA